MEDELLTIAEAGRLLRIGRTKTYALARTGDLPIVRIGRAIRIHRTSLEALIDAAVRSNGSESSVITIDIFDAATWRQHASRACVCPYPHPVGQTVLVDRSGSRGACIWRDPCPLFSTVLMPRAALVARIMTPLEEWPDGE